MKKILNLGVLLLFLSLFTLASYLLAVSKKTTDGESKIVAKQTQQTNENQTPADWRTYLNKDYYFSLKYPPLLYQRELENQGGYLYFIRFEETEFSRDKGLAVGVSDENSDDEIKRIKQEFSQGAKLVNEGEIDLGEIKAIRLDFEPEIAGGEKRTVVIFNKGEYSYSLSSVPEQIEKILAGFDFLD